MRKLRKRLTTPRSTVVGKAAPIIDMTLRPLTNDPNRAARTLDVMQVLEPSGASGRAWRRASTAAGGAFCRR
jgi:hypothetical protein